MRASNGSAYLLAVFSARMAIDLRRCGTTSTERAESVRPPSACSSPAARVHDRLLPVDHEAHASERDPPEDDPLVRSTRSRGSTASSARTPGGRCSSPPPRRSVFLGLAVGWWLFIIGAFFGSSPSSAGPSSTAGPARPLSSMRRWVACACSACGRLSPSPGSCRCRLLDAEVVRDLVHDGHGDLVAQLLEVLAHPGQRAAEEGDPVGQEPRSQPAPRSVSGAPS